MTIRNLIIALCPDTYVRIRVVGVTDVAGKTGKFLTQRLIEELERKKSADAYVTAVYPLWHAHEVYIECAPNVIQCAYAAPT